MLEKIKDALKTDKKGVKNGSPFYSYHKIPPQVFFPTSFDEVDQITSVIERHHPVIVNVSSLAIKDRYRIIDFLSGYIFALKGTREKLENSIYMFYVK